MVEKGTRGGICHAIHRYSKSNDKYMKNYKQASYIKYLDAKKFVWMGNVSKTACRWF